MKGRGKESNAKITEKLSILIAEYSKQTLLAAKTDRRKNRRKIRKMKED